MRLRSIAIFAVLAVMMTLMVTTVAANHGPNHGQGEADCPEGSTFLINIDAQDILALQEDDLPFELGTTDVFVTDFTLDGSNELATITIMNSSTTAIRVALKAGSDQVGEPSAVIAIGASATLSMTTGKAISNFSICSVPTTTPNTPTLSLEKVITGGAAGDDELDFTFTMTTNATGSVSPSFTTDANDPALLLTSASGSFTITELEQAGWTLSNMTCAGGTVTATGARSITVTVGENEDVVCTFTNAKIVTSALSPTLSLDKVVTAGNANLGFSFTLNGTALANPVTASQPALLVSSTAGTYTIVELAQSGWNLASIDCVGNATAEAVNSTTRTVTVTVGADEDVTCTFTNTPQGGAVLPGNPATATPVRSGTAGSTGAPGGAVPNTAMELPSNGVSVSVLALIALVGLGYVAHRNVVVNRNRR